MNRTGKAMAVAVVALGFLAAPMVGCRDTNREKATAEQQRQRALAAFPYLAEVGLRARDRGKSGVSLHVKERAWQGLNLRVIRKPPSAELLDMDGKVVHRWELPEMAPVPEMTPLLRESFSDIRIAELAGDGALHVIHKFERLLRLDAQGRMTWSAHTPVHHDFDIADDGNILVLSSRLSFVTARGHREPYREDLIVELDAEGREVRRLSMFKILESNPGTASLLRGELGRRAGWSATINDFPFLIPNPGRVRQAKDELLKHFHDVRDGKLKDGVLALESLGLTPGDLFHANSIEILPRAHPGLWDRGDLLISLRNLNLVLVVGASDGAVKWHWGPGQLDWQHHPSLLANGNILIFDNGFFRKWSRLVEVDPATGQVVWQYAPSPRDSFFSEVMGSAQELPNGNILVTESLAGRVFELDRSGGAEAKIVWEYVSPQQEKDLALRHSGRALNAPLIGSIYRWKRYSPDMLDRIKGPPVAKKR